MAGIAAQVGDLPGKVAPTQQKGTAYGNSLPDFNLSL
jgi:hypothetical protein